MKEVEDANWKMGAQYSEIMEKEMTKATSTKTDAQTDSTLKTLTQQISKAQQEGEQLKARINSIEKDLKVLF